MRINAYIKDKNQQILPIYEERHVKKKNYILQLQYLRSLFVVEIMLSN